MVGVSGVLIGVMASIIAVTSLMKFLAVCLFILNTVRDHVTYKLQFYLHSLMKVTENKQIYIQRKQVNSPACQLAEWSTD